MYKRQVQVSAAYVATGLTVFVRHVVYLFKFDQPPTDMCLQTDDCSLYAPTDAYTVHNDIGFLTNNDLLRGIFYDLMMKYSCEMHHLYIKRKSQGGLKTVSLSIHTSDLDTV